LRGARGEEFLARRTADSLQPLPRGAGVWRRHQAQSRRGRRRSGRTRGCPTWSAGLWPAFPAAGSAGLW